MKRTIVFSLMTLLIAFIVQAQFPVKAGITTDVGISYIYDEAPSVENIQVYNHSPFNFQATYEVTDRTGLLCSLVELRADNETVSGLTVAPNEEPIAKINNDLRGTNTRFEAGDICSFDSFFNKYADNDTDPLNRYCTTRGAITRLDIGESGSDSKS